MHSAQLVSIAQVHWRLQIFKRLRKERNASHQKLIAPLQSIHSLSNETFKYTPLRMGYARKYWGCERINNFFPLHLLLFAFLFSSTLSFASSPSLFFTVTLFIEWASSLAPFVYAATTATKNGECTLSSSVIEKCTRDEAHVSTVNSLQQLESNYEHFMSGEIKINSSILLSNELFKWAKISGSLELHFLIFWILSECIKDNRI